MWLKRNPLKRNHEVNRVMRHGDYVLHYIHCSVLQCCSALQFVAVCCSVLQWSDSIMRHAMPIPCYAALCRSVLHCVAVCCSVLQCSDIVMRHADYVLRCSVLQCCSNCNTLQNTAPYCNTLQHNAAHDYVYMLRCRVLQCVAMCCSALMTS